MLSVIIPTEGVEQPAVATLAALPLELLAALPLKQLAELPAEQLPRLPPLLSADLYLGQWRGPPRERKPPRK